MLAGANGVITLKNDHKISKSLSIDNALAIRRSLDKRVIKSFWEKKAATQLSWGSPEPFYSVCATSFIDL